MRLVGLTQHTYFRNGGNLLDLVFSHFTFLISMKYSYTCWSPLILPTLLLSLKCSYLLENQIGFLIFLSEVTLPAITCCYITAFTPTIDLLSTMRPLLAVGRLFVAVTQASKIAVPSVFIKNCKFTVWFSENFRYYTRKRITFTLFLRNVGLINFMQIIFIS